MFVVDEQASAIEIQTRLSLGVRDLHVRTCPTIDGRIFHNLDLGVRPRGIGLHVVLHLSDDLTDHRVQSHVRNLHQAFRLSQFALWIDVDGDKREAGSTATNGQLSIILPLHVQDEAILHFARCQKMHANCHRDLPTRPLLCRPNLNVDEAMRLEHLVDALALDQQAGVVANRGADLLLPFFRQQHDSLQRMLSRFRLHRNDEGRKRKRQNQ